VPRPIHFEIPADQPERAMAFYQQVFGWRFQKWEGPMPYWLVQTGGEGPGIDGGLLARQHPGQGTVNTVDVPNCEEFVRRIESTSAGIHKGVFAGNEEGWRGPSPAAKPFMIQALKIDSDAAYEIALKKGKKAAEYMKANPDKNVMFLLEQNNKFPNLTWRVIWGESVGTSNYSVFVDATTGEYLETMR